MTMRFYADSEADMAAWRIVQGWNRGARMRNIVELINRDVEEAAYRGTKRALQEALAEGRLVSKPVASNMGAPDAGVTSESQEDRWESATSDWEDADLSNAPEISDSVLSFLRSMDES